MECAPTDLVPRGPGVDPKYQGCAVSGARIGSTNVTGNNYLSTTYNYSRSHLWRNFGVVIAFAVLYILVTVLATESVNFAAGQGGGALIFKKTRKAKKQTQEAATPADEEKAVGHTGGVVSTGSSVTNVGDSSNSSGNKEMQQLAKSESIFTWKDVEYSVPYLGGQRKLLNKVSGYAKPGVMVALMGASGAGKTTLLNTLSQRQSVGVVSGEMLVDGRTLNQDFQRNTGFCLQGDIHDRTQTVREAIEFSAILRQDASIPRSEKLEYVDKIINLLELNDLQDAIIISLGLSSASD